MEFVHHGVPQMVLESELNETKLTEPEFAEPQDYTKRLKDMLSRENIASKEYITRQFDHEVQGTSVIKHLVGKEHDVFSDAAVVRPLFGSFKGIAVSVGINPKGATKEGHNIDGVLPDDQRRSGPFKWPPPKENYVYTGLQGVLAEAVILYRAGYDVWNWQDKAILRAFNWLYFVCHYPAKGDDTWEPYLINYYYGTHFPTIVPSKPGKNVGWTDWTHAPLKKAAATDGGITN